MRNIYTATIMILALAAFSPPAHADAIDGSWCNTQGDFFEIHGSAITTPGGQNLSGEYSRHTFRYVAPAGERAAGQTLNMALVDDETLHLIVEGSGNQIEVWRRCTDKVS